MYAMTCSVLPVPGQQIEEPVAWNGPIVMNTEQLLQVYNERQFTKSPDYSVLID